MDWKHIGLLLAVLAGSAAAAPVAGVLDRPAQADRQAQARVLLGLDRLGSRVIAVGERGLALLSVDDGRSWRQAAVPVSVTLTAVRVVTPALAVAVGHGGVVLRSTDGGASWRRQLDGRDIVRLLDAAAAADAALAAVARQYAADGPDKPLLDVHFHDARRGIAVGAYGLALATADGGATWRPLMGAIDNPDGLHVYAIAARGDETWLAGEQGYVARSLDGGRTFARVASPYRGTFFTATMLPEGVLLAGLRGNAFRWTGSAFVPQRGQAPVSLGAAASLPGGVLLADQGGHLYRVAADVARMVPLARPLPPVAALVASADGGAIAAGARGITRIPAAVLAVGGQP